MKRFWFLLGISALTAVLAVGAYACGDDDDDDDDGDGASATATEVIVPDDTVLQLVANLSPEGDSTASGTADITIDGEGISVNIVMEGLSEGAHPNHLHHGSCAEQGEIHITLDNIVADDSGDGTQTTGNDEAPLSHFETDHYLAVHEEDFTVVACGDVVAA